METKKQIPEGPKGKGYKKGDAVTVKTNQKPHMS